MTMNAGHRFPKRAALSLTKKPIFRFLVSKSFTGLKKNLTKARMISMFTPTARLLRSTLESMATPCSVKAWGRYFRCRPRPLSNVTICDLKAADSSGVSSNMKSAGNRSSFRLTAWFKTFVDTARSATGPAQIPVLRVRFALSKVQARFYSRFNPSSAHILPKS